MDNGCQQHRPEISTYWLSLDNEKNMSCSHIPTVHAVILSVPAWSCISELLHAPRVLREPQSQHCQSRSPGCILTWKEDTLVHEHWGLQTYRGKKGGGIYHLQHTDLNLLTSLFSPFRWSNAMVVSNSIFLRLFRKSVSHSFPRFLFFNPVPFALCHYSSSSCVLILPLQPVHSLSKHFFNGLVGLLTVNHKK